MILRPFLYDVTACAALAAADVDAFVRELLVDVPLPPADQAAIVAANRTGVAAARA